MSNGLKWHTCVTTFLFTGIAIGKLLPDGGIATIIFILVVLWLFNFTEDNFKGGRYVKKH